MSEVHIHRERPPQVVHAIIARDHEALSVMGRHGNLIRRRKRAIERAKLQAARRAEEAELAQLHEEESQTDPQIDLFSAPIYYSYPD